MMKLWEFVNELKSPAYCWVDLTHELSPATPHWYGFGDLTTEVIYDFSPDCIFHFRQIRHSCRPIRHPRRRPGPFRPRSTHAGPNDAEGNGISPRRRR